MSYSRDVEPKKDHCTYSYLTQKIVYPSQQKLQLVIYNTTEIVTESSRQGKNKKSKREVLLSLGLNRVARNSTELGDYSRAARRRPSPGTAAVGRRRQE